MRAAKQPANSTCRHEPPTGAATLDSRPRCEHSVRTVLAQAGLVARAFATGILDSQVPESRRRGREQQEPELVRQGLLRQELDIEGDVLAVKARAAELLCRCQWQWQDG